MTIRIFRLACLILVFQVVVVPAFPQQVVTNLVTSPSNFRHVAGQLYDTDKSYRWSDITINFGTRAGGIAYAREVQFKNEFGDAARIIGPMIAITNAPDDLLSERDYTIRTMVVGTITLTNQARILPLHDCGILNKITVIRTNFSSVKL